MIASLISIIPLLIIVILGVMLFSQITAFQRAEWGLREFMLSMEVDGYLTPDNKVVLLDKLNQMGVSDVSLDGTTMTKRDYGDEIVLSVKGKIKVQGMKEGGSWFKTEEYFEDFSYQQKSTFLGGNYEETRMASEKDERGSANLHSWNADILFANHSFDTYILD